PAGGAGVCRSSARHARPVSLQRVRQVRPVPPLRARQARPVPPQRARQARPAPPSSPACPPHSRTAAGLTCSDGRPFLTWSYFDIGRASCREREEIPRVGVGLPHNTVRRRRDESLSL